MDQGRDEVRIMTVHAAKGLEAPVVFLLDSGAAPFSDQHLPRLMPFEPRGQLWQGNGYLWRVGQRHRQRLFAGRAARVKEAAEEEYRRLLYVGMTRAEDRLIVCGWHKSRPPVPRHWHSMVAQALLPESTEVDHPATDGLIIAGQASGKTWSMPGARCRQRQPRPLICRPASRRPGWLTTPVRREPPVPRPLTPSGAASAVDAASDYGT